MSSDRESFNELIDSVSDRIDRMYATAQLLYADNLALRAFLKRMCDPEDLGHAVSNEVRALARAFLNTN